MTNISSTADLLAQKKALSDQINEIKGQLRDIDNTLSQRYLDMLRSQFTRTGKVTGTVSVRDGGLTVKGVIKKTVRWDQKVLAGIVENAPDLVSRGFVKVEYHVGEREYDVFPSELRLIIDSARSVQTGPVQIVFE